MKQKLYISFLFVALAALFAANATPHHHHGAEICVTDDVTLSCLEKSGSHTSIAESCGDAAELCGQEGNGGCSNETHSHNQAEMMCPMHTVVLLSSSQCCLFHRVFDGDKPDSFVPSSAMEVFTPPLIVHSDKQRIIPHECTPLSAHWAENYGMRAPPVLAA